MVTKDYDKPGITVHWDSSRCIHTAICIRSLPSVFDTRRRPWIDMDGGTVEEIAEAVLRCPTGALRFTSDVVTEEQPVDTVMRPLQGGPMIVRGKVDIVDRDGNVLRRETRIAFCRCGHSLNQPFCDNSHRTNGFAEPDPNARDGAEAPSDVCDPQPGFD